MLLQQGSLKASMPSGSLLGETRLLPHALRRGYLPYLHEAYKRRADF